MPTPTTPVSDHPEPPSAWRCHECAHHHLAAERECLACDAPRGEPAPEPLPCPFCGGAAEGDRDEWGSFEVTCDGGECEATGPRRMTLRASIEAWNARTVSP